MLSQSIKRIKKYHYSAILPVVLILTDMWVIVFLFDLINHFWPVMNINAEGSSLINMNILLSWLLAGVIASAYRLENLDKHSKIISRATWNFFIFIGLVFGLVFMVGKVNVMPADLLMVGVIILVAVMAIRLSLLHFYTTIKHKFPARKNIIIVGNTPRGKALAQHFESTTSLPLNFFGFFDDQPDKDTQKGKSQYLGKLDQVKRFCLENDVNEIYFSLDGNEEFYEDLKAFADDHFIFLGILPNLGDRFDRKLDAILVGDSRIPVITSRKIPLHVLINRQIKRGFDIVFSFTALTILSFTIFPVIALAIKLTSPGPVFFKQLRPGKNNRLFWCYKFRTMKVGCDDQKQATKGDSRVTKVGAFLRKTSLDELPQFYNVLKGDMSVVGPRPNLVKHLEEYQHNIKEYPQRHWILPGITGISQVNGLRGETADVALMKKRIDLDLFYLENWCLAMDIKIIFKTVKNMLKGEDKAY
jgi:putative colanic acid biosysnthesis UDP-glucose lipid carrier transferase